MIFLPASRRVAQPWKNGGGVTREVAAFPPGAGMDRFDWRVSIADVGTDGPFSIFPDIDRTLTILSGAGITLDMGGDTLRLLPGRPVSFPGDQPAAAALLDGPVTDLNVMSRRGKIGHKVAALSAAQTLSVGEGVLVWISGQGRVDGVAMGPLDAVQADAPGEWAVEGKDFLAYYAAFTRL